MSNTPSSSPSPRPIEEVLNKDLSFTSLKNNIENGIGLMTSIEGLRRNLKVYRDESGNFVPSAKSVVDAVERMKSPDGSWPIRDSVLDYVSWGSQVVSRSWYKQTYKDVIKDVHELERELIGSLQLIDEAVEADNLSLGELKNLREGIVLLKGKVGNADTIAAIYEKSAKGKGTKLDDVKTSVDNFKKDLNSQIDESLKKLDAKMAQFSPKEISPPSTPPPFKVLQEKQSIEEPQPEKVIESIVTMEKGHLSPPPSPISNEGSERVFSSTEISASSPVSKEASEEKVSEMKSSPPPSPPIQESIGKEDMNQKIDISKELKSAPPAKRNVREDNILDALEIEDIQLKDVVQSMTREGIYCLQRIVTNYWMVRCYGGTLLPETDPIVKRLAPLKFNGKSLQEVLNKMKTTELTLWKKCLVNYWYTYGILK